MSDQVQSESVPNVEATTECTICGLVPGPDPECGTCHGNQTFVGPRHFTRTEEIRGAQSDPRRYSRTGNVSPKIVMLPGSFDPTQNQ